MGLQSFAKFGVWGAHILDIGRVRMLIGSCCVGLRREHACDVTIMTIGIPGIANSRNSEIHVSLHILYGWLS